MTHITENLQNHHATVIARWDDEGGASKSALGKRTKTASDTSTSWFVPPIAVPAFLAAVMMASLVYQRYWHFLG